MITVAELATRLGGTLLSGEEQAARNVTGGYAGDLLSWVMGRAAADCAWLTIMGNLNAVAVAVLADVSCIVLCEGVTLEPDALARAQEQGVAVIGTGLPVFESAIRLGESL